MIAQLAAYFDTLARQVPDLINKLKTDWTMDFLTVLRRLVIPRGLDADKESSPVAGAVCSATDTHRTYACFEDGAWEPIAGYRAVLIPAGGTLANGTNVTFEIPVPYTMDCYEIHLRVKTAPTGQDLLVDVLCAGESIYGSAVAVTADSNESSQAIVPPATLMADDLLTVDITQVGSGEPGQDLIVELRCLPGAEV